MADISLSVAGRSYAISARDGEEPHLRHLETILQKHAATALRASGGLNAERTLVYLSLILADLLDESGRFRSGFRIEFSAQPGRQRIVFMQCGCAIATLIEHSQEPPQRRFIEFRRKRVRAAAPRHGANRSGFTSGIPYRLGSGAEFPSIVVIRNYKIAR